MITPCLCPRREDLMVTVSKGDCVLIAKEIVKEYRENAWKRQ
ncbi:MAG TPA: hypothetical protein VFG45_01010 [Candidatus Nitrosocosmicus sp.]|nr:hypothetical protein [Candidatus Nitrosocosmicus sp.]